MADRVLSFEHGIISLNGSELPGILKDMRITGRVRYDESKVDGMSGRQKTPVGYEDSVLQCSMDLLTDDFDTCYNKLAVLNILFKSTTGTANPPIYTVINTHAQARGMEHVVFDELISTETDSDDIILVNIIFKEHLPAETKKENDVTGNFGTPGVSYDAEGDRPAAEAPAIDAQITYDARKGPEGSAIDDW